MREIKFRAWDKEKKDLFEVVSINYKKKRVYSSWNDLDGKNLYAEFDQAVLMQYTGLVDKNGVEIYEGDILEIEDKGLMAESKIPEKMKYVLSYDDNELAGYIINNLNNSIHKLFTCEVIGNVFENPELLEGDNE